MKINREGRKTEATRGRAKRGVWIMQKSLHLHIMMLILWKRNTAEKWWRVGGGRKKTANICAAVTKKKEKENTHTMQHYMHGCRAVLYMSADSAWGKFTLKWNYGRSGLRSKV